MTIEIQKELPYFLIQQGQTIFQDAHTFFHAFIGLDNQFLQYHVVVKSRNYNNIGERESNDVSE